MILLVTRDQRRSLLGTPIFQLDVRAELSDEERNAIRRYQLSDTLLYTKDAIADRGAGLLGLASRMAFHAMNISVKVRDLADGKRIECKDIVEMLAVEEQIVEATRTFKAVLNAAMNFGGEQAFEI